MFVELMILARVGSWKREEIKVFNEKELLQLIVELKEK
jgi:hypothetical protein